MKCFLSLTGLVFCFLQLIAQSVEPVGKSFEKHLPDKIIFKIKPENASVVEKNTVEHNAFKKALIVIGSSEIVKKFPFKERLTEKTNNKGETLVDLSLIYELSITGKISLEKAVNELMRTGIIEYAEPHFIPELLYTPNDPELAQQYALSNIKAFQAWDIYKGDTNVYVGIVDTGTDLLHPDLMGNIKFNYNDPINGIDDDGDGYIDNFYGWDLAEGNNDPQSENIHHGVHVSGISSASTNNGIGMAGTGFLCKFLPVKISNAAGQLTHAYEGIVYAADMGCKVINCSWGSTIPSAYGRDIVNYATNNKDALVIGAAGNNDLEQKFYPAAYDVVLAVAATNSSDIKWENSNYGYYIDVSAPGAEIFSTWPGSLYTGSSGTSMAAPSVSGAAALLRAYFPSFSAVQAAQLLKVSSDNINSINPLYANKLGMGRLNMLRAITENTSPAVVMKERTVLDKNDELFVIGDTLHVSGFFQNYLADASNVTISISSSNNFVQILNNSVSLGAMASLAIANNHETPFKILIKPNAPENAEAKFLITISADGFTDIVEFTEIVNVDYINITVNKIGTTITSKGRIGYNKENQQEGIGFTYKSFNTLLYEGGLMIGRSPQVVSSVVRGPGVQNNDFLSLNKVGKVIPSIVSEFDLEGIFNDTPSLTPLNIKVKHKAYAWNTTADQNYVIVNYEITNNSSSVISNLFAGLFMDWDIQDYSRNKANYDSDEKLGYTWNTEANGLYAGVKLLSSDAPANFYAIDNISGGGGGVDITSGYDNSKKYLTLSTQRLQAGTSEGNDVAVVMSSGPFNLIPGEVADVSFALIAGESLNTLISAGQAAQIKYESEVPLNVNEKAKNNFLLKSYPNPASSVLNIEYQILKPSQVQISLYNFLGEKLSDIADNYFVEGIHKTEINISHYPSGFYFLNINFGGNISMKKFIVAK
jgi:serine protease